ncbi:MAG: phage portal protein [Clostridiales bacterium]|nr:phage portal protein [Clostridiales bacterium]
MGRLSKRRRQAARAEPAKRRSAAWLCAPDAFEALTCQGYTSLAHNPEVCAAVDTIAKLMGSMTIHLMQNTDKGDIRIKNELSRKMDINPNSNMTRSAFIHWVVKNLYLDGNGNVTVFPQTRRGYLQDLRPIPPAMAAYIPDGLWDYRVAINGREYDPDDVLHFVMNPDSYYPWLGTGYRVSLVEVANNLKQASKTEKGFMESKWKPSLIVKVDALAEEFSRPEGRKRLLDSYIDTAQAGEPWIIPAEQFEVEQVKPLSLSDLALADMVTLDKRTVASILGVPPFVLGVGDFNRDAWNNFVNATIMPLARSIEQELSKKLLFSGELFFRFNSWSLFSYSITELVSAGAEMIDRMALRRNEWRSWVNMPPDTEMDELLALENYLPADRLGDQGKLVQNGGG